MKRIMVFGFKDIDVSEGLGKLLDKHPESVVYVPIVDNFVFAESVVRTVKEHKAKYQIYFSDAGEEVDKMIMDADDITVCVNPIKEILREVASDDVVALAWDDGVHSHLVLHSVEDYGVETWDISDGLDPITIEQGDSDDLYEEMQEKLHDFIEVFAAYITQGILEQMTNTIDAMLQDQLNPEDDNPFGRE
mgnify:CR=1 FL=1